MKTVVLWFWIASVGFQPHPKDAYLTGNFPSYTYCPLRVDWDGYEKCLDAPHVPIPLELQGK